MTRALRALLAVGLVAGLSACAAESVWAPEEAVARAAFAPEGSTRVALITAINNQSGSGGHSALLIDGSQRLLFDPAGSWHHPNIPERNDVLFGMSPVYMQFYTDYHARETYHLVVQEVDVSPDTAAQLSAAVRAYGAVPPARCAQSISTILSRASGFETVSRSWYPRRVMEDFGSLPGVRTSYIYDDDSDDNLELLQAQARAALSAQITAAAGGD